MRAISWFLSFLLHATVVVAGLFLAVPTPMNVRLDVPVYQVDLVQLVPLKGVAVPRPAAPKSPTPPPAKPLPAAKPAPAPAPAPEAAPMPEPKPLAKAIAPKAQEKPQPKAEANATAKPQKKPAQEKPQKTKQQLLAEALKQAQRDVKWKERQERKVMSDALADLRRQVAKEDAKAETEGAGGESTEGVVAGLEEIYAAQVKALIQENWRYPSIPVDAALAATVFLRVGPDGSITEMQLLGTSGRSDYDASVMRAVEETRQLPPPPGNLTQLRINFNLQDMQ
ncbi:colicin import membrane protein [Desulfobaculum xiamenense]|uniref:Colicin import membrane protein n=1 Tax=Desulfobaculum xiamenense TaxID=995050 RepID=A0A846QF19_9BACT|nr:cell envelope integrity protein TolA [Desulfobaculum xiamenense]NJB67366.1 colicin import membrane protein [Desulfobaculum xiamenense]